MIVFLLGFLIGGSATIVGCILASITKRAVERRTEKVGLSILSAILAFTGLCVLIFFTFLSVPLFQSKPFRWGWNFGWLAMVPVGMLILRRMSGEHRGGE
jgi:fatty acid desaturase